jgi:hypothetical protein
MVPGESDGFVNDWFLYDEELKFAVGESASLPGNQSVAAFCRRSAKKRASRKGKKIKGQE